MKKAMITMVILSTTLMAAGCVRSSSVSRPAESTSSITEQPSEETAVPAEAEESAAEADADEDTPAEILTGLSAVRQAVDDAGDICAVAYVGRHNSEQKDIQTCLSSQDNPVVAAYPEILMIPAEQRVEYAGEDIYLIVPGSAVARIVVEEYCPAGEDGTEFAGELIYTADANEPILISCNVSDIMENVRIIISSEGRDDLIVSPTISLKDGTVVLPEQYVMDFTVYTWE